MQALPQDLWNPFRIVHMTVKRDRREEFQNKGNDGGGGEVGGCPAHCGMFTDILGLHHLDAGVPPPQDVTSKVSPDIVQWPSRHT